MKEIMVSNVPARAPPAHRRGLELGRKPRLPASDGSNQAARLSFGGPSRVFSEDGCNRLVQRRLLSVATGVSVYIGPHGNQHLSGSSMRLRVAGSPSGAPHRRSVTRGRSHDGVLVEISTATKKQINGLGTAGVRSPCEWRQPPITSGIVRVCAYLNQPLTQLDSVAVSAVAHGSN